MAGKHEGTLSHPYHDTFRAIIASITSLCKGTRLGIAFAMSVITSHKMAPLELHM
jgi:hypothetical protein